VEQLIGMVDAVCAGRIEGGVTRSMNGGFEPFLTDASERAYGG